MIIIAWNGSGDISAVFETDVFKKVLSIFITAAILKLAQGKINYGNILMLIIPLGFELLLIVKEANTLFWNI